MDKFQWCLDNFESSIVHCENLIETITKQLNKKQAGNEELDILHRLYKMDKEYKLSFEILLKMGSKNCFEFFRGTYADFDPI